MLRQQNVGNTLHRTFGMYWEEKIDVLKKKFSQTDFRSPFTDWPEIPGKIEAKFVIKNNPDHHFTNWADHLKNKIFLRAVQRPAIFREIKKLDANSNYWVVIVSGNSPDSRHLVYDCKVNAMEALISLAPGDFYIVGKKYNWLLFSEADNEANEVRMFKSGHGSVPFDK